VFGREYVWPTTFIYWLLFAVTSTKPFALAQTVIRGFGLRISIAAHMGLLVEKVAQPRVFPRILGLSSFSITISSPMLLVYDSSN
jgi:hypothetical protein